MSSGALSQRQVRVGKELRAQLSRILLHATRWLPQIQPGSISITEVRPSRDLRRAIVYISSFEKSDQLAEDLQKHRHLFQKELAENFSLKFLPHLVFKADPRTHYEAEIARILDEERKGRGF